MACNGCGTGSPKGCRSNGNCGTGGCNRMNVMDWLGDMDIPSMARFPFVEVKFKGGRKAFYRNEGQHELITGDAVVVEESRGYDVGYVSLQGELVRLQMKRKKVAQSDRLPKILRRASSEDLDKQAQAKNRELPTMYRTREIIRDLGLKMKLSDVEFQVDGSRAVFYYSAENRVDFRELIKLLAVEFKIRIEMRQIGLRQEAGRVGGIGVCGRELCCSTWLSEFKAVSTSAARYQNLSLNPAKLAGQCGRLKCCLNYELDTYLDALQDIPKVEKGLRTEKGRARLEKTDIFKRTLWFSLKDTEGWTALSVENVLKAQKLNEEGVTLPSLVPEDWEEKEDEKPAQHSKKKRRPRRRKR
ncbi:MAG: regulatory iron-sulfur-containing complex subunit RicT [Bacteroidota bacterium]